MSAVKWKFSIFWIKEAFFLNCAVCSKNICKVSTVDNWNEAFLLHPRLSHNAALLVPCKAVWADSFDYPLKQASSLMPAFSHPFILRLCLFVSAFLHSCLFCVSAGWSRCYIWLLRVTLHADRSFHFLQHPLKGFCVPHSSRLFPHSLSLRVSVNSIL